MKRIISLLSLSLLASLTGQIIWGDSVVGNDDVIIWSN